MNGTIVKKYLPALGLMSAVVQWFKPHTCVNYKSSQSLMLLLCRSFKLILPAVVLSSFWIFDSDDSEYRFYELRLSRRLRSLLRQPYVREFEDDDDDNEWFYNDDDEDNDEDNEGFDSEDDDESDEDTINFCSYMEEFDPEVDVVNHYDSPLGFFRYHTDFN